MSDHEQQVMAGAYGRFLAELLCVGVSAAEDEPTDAPLDELEVQGLWATGILGNEGDTVGHGHVRILDFGEWNRCAGPDFLNAELELAGRRIRGDIEIDRRAQDWEAHGHGSNPLYHHVALHITLTPPPAGWFTRDSLHREVPVMHLSASRVRQTLDMAPPLDREVVHLCRKPLQEMSAPELESLLKAAAAHRVACKRKRFHRKAEALGESQAWYEAWAETLGYRANKETMLMLARRAPLRALGHDAEAILFGTAGFLTPVLPTRATKEARAYHRSVWDAWWKLRKDFSLDDDRALSWNLSGMRPLNHPHRRVAALALTASHWHELEPLLNVAHMSELRSYLSGLTHPFWELHCTLSSAPMARSAALVGKERVHDFLINHVCVLDESPAAWAAYVRMKAGAGPTRAQRIAEHLFGSRDDMRALLRYSYAQQGLLQIESDFCSQNACSECLFPEQLRQWSAPAV